MVRSTEVYCSVPSEQPVPEGLMAHISAQVTDRARTYLALEIPKVRLLRLLEHGQDRASAITLFLPGL